MGFASPGAIHVGGHDGRNDDTRNLTLNVMSYHVPLRLLFFFLLFLLSGRRRGGADPGGSQSVRMHMNERH